MGEPDHLHLVELVHPHQSPGVPTCSPGLRAEAGSEAGVEQGQFGGFQDLVPVQVRQRDLGGRDQVEVVGGAAEQVLFELGQLSRCVHRVAGDQRGGQDLGIPVLTGMQLEHEGDQGPFQARPLPLQQPEPRAGQLGRALEVHDPQVFAQVPVGLEGVGEGRPLPPNPDLDVVAGVAAIGSRGVGKIRDPIQELLLFLLQGGALAVQRGDLEADLAHAGRGLRDVLARLLAPPQIGRHLVALLLQVVPPGDRLPAQDVQLHQAVDHFGTDAPAGQGGLDDLRFATDLLDVQHDDSMKRGLRRARSAIGARDLSRPENDRAATGTNPAPLGSRTGRRLA